MKKLIIFMLILITISNNIYSQVQNDQFDCQFFNPSNSNNAISTPYGGRVKPNRTDMSGGLPASEDAYFPVLVVFVQFKDEPSDPRGTWPRNSAPTYLNNMISKQKRTNGNWWEYYNPETEILSSQWAEISRGVFHVISPVPDTVSNGAFSVVLPKTAQEYFTFFNYNKYKSDSAIHCDIWASVTSQGLTDWRAFDRWKKVGNLFYYTPIGQGDGKVDMIYKITKYRGGWVQDSIGTWTTIFLDKAGYNQLGTNYSTETQVDSFGTKINYGGDENGSGVTVSFRGQLAQYIGTMGHEHGHQLFSGGHSTYSRVSYGFGYDYFYSPADMILNGYMSSRNCTFNSTNGLYDYSSRNSGSGEILKIPVQGNEYFLLVSRNKVSKWDRVMIGDSAQVDTYGDNSESGKGLYIYHVPDGLNFPGGDISQQDMECADGLFKFEYAGQSAQQVVQDCYISGSNAWYYYKKKSVIYNNDSSVLDRYAPTYAARLVGDGISFRPYFGIINGEYAYGLKWWGEGAQPTDNCDIGIDRTFTNKKEIYTNFEVGGDRWDA